MAGVGKAEITLQGRLEPVPVLERDWVVKMVQMDEVFSPAAVRFVTQVEREALSRAETCQHEEDQQCDAEKDDRKLQKSAPDVCQHVFPLSPESNEEVRVGRTPPGFQN